MYDKLRSQGDPSKMRLLDRLHLLWSWTEFGAFAVSCKLNIYAHD